MSNAKKMGLSFDEVNLFRLRDLIEFTDIYTAEFNQNSKARNATQADIDRLLN